MARSSKHGVSEASLVERATVKNRPALSGTGRRRGRPTKAAAAGAWGLEQFSAPKIHAALDSFGVEEMIRTLVALARNDTLDDKKRPIVPATARLKAIERIRDLHGALASTEAGIAERSGVADLPGDDDGDPDYGRISLGDNRTQDEHIAAET